MINFLIHKCRNLCAEDGDAKKQAKEAKLAVRRAPTDYRLAWGGC
jgi:hypothetical protein